MEGSLMSSPTDSPLQLNFEQQRKRAKDLRRAHQEGSVQAAVRIGRHLPRARGLPLESILASRFTLSEAQLVVAREAGFSSWPNLKQDVQAAADGGPERSEFLIDAALEGHDDAVAAALDRDPEAPWRSIYLAAAMADTEAVFAALDADAGAADRAGGRRAWKPLLYLCACRYRRAESGAARSNPLGESDIAKKSPLTRWQRGSPVSCLPSGSKPCSCHSITSASASTTINDRTDEFSSTATAV
jgi:hypothetical protein